MLIVHIVCSGLLIFAHGFFLFRGIYLLTAGKKPGRLDKAAKFCAQLFIPLSIAPGLISLRTYRADFPLHILPVILIILLVPANFILRRLVLKTKKLPWLLPAAVFVLMLVAFCSGLSGLLQGWR